MQIGLNCACNARKWRMRYVLDIWDLDIWDLGPRVMSNRDATMDNSCKLGACVRTTCYGGGCVGVRAKK